MHTLTKTKKALLQKQSWGNKKGENKKAINIHIKDLWYFYCHNYQTIDNGIKLE
jgi:hypothetical protein